MDWREIPQIFDWYVAVWRQLELQQSLTSQKEPQLGDRCWYRYDKAAAALYVAQLTCRSVTVVSTILAAREAPYSRVHTAKRAAAGKLLGPRPVLTRKATELVWNYQVR